MLKQTLDLFAVGKHTNCKDDGLPTIDLEVQRDSPKFDPKKHYLGILCVRGHDYEETGQSWRHRGHFNCVTCTRERARSWNKENPERTKISEQRRKAKLKNLSYSHQRRRWPILTAISAKKNNCRRLGIPINIDSQYMRDLWKKQNGKCYWTGITLDFHIGKARDPRRPSIDRINAKLGYVRGNVVWATNFANRARGEMNAEDFYITLRTISESVMQMVKK